MEKFRQRLTKLVQCFLLHTVHSCRALGDGGGNHFRRDGRRLDILAFCQLGEHLLGDVPGQRLRRCKIVSNFFFHFPQRRYDEQYGKIDEIEVQIDDVQSQLRSIRQEKISGDNIYRLLLAFDQVYEAASEVERKEFMRAFIERIELFPEKQPDGNWIRKIIFNRRLCC